MKNYYKDIVFAAAVLIIYFIVSFLTGCTVLQSSEPEPVLEPISPAIQIIRETISKTDWLSSLFILGIAGGVFVGLNGLKTGWLASVAALVGLVVKAGLSNVYVYWMCGLILLAVIVLILLSIFVKNRAIKELICGIQRIKPNIDKKKINKNLKQSKETTSLVLNTKAKLKAKGKI